MISAFEKTGVPAKEDSRVPSLGGSSEQRERVVRLEHRPVAKPRRSVADGSFGPSALARMAGATIGYGH